MHLNIEKTVGKPNPPGGFNVWQIEILNTLKELYKKKHAKEEKKEQPKKEAK